MLQCLRCGREIEPDSLYCRYCGEKISSSASDSAFDRLYEEDYRAFIGKNADCYLSKFRKFQVSERGNYAVTWNWPAFFLGFIWMLYRKIYLWALLAFLITLTPIGFPLTMIAWGVTGNYLYFLHARKKILDHKSQQKISSETAPPLSELGGVNRWVWFLGIFFFLLLLVIAIMGILFLFYLLKVGYFYLPELIEI
jgi:hypothetical protein